jgi:hypothetical protein
MALSNAYDGGVAHISSGMWLSNSVVVESSRRESPRGDM